MTTPAPTSPNPAALLPDIEKLAREAGAEIMRHYNDPATKIYTKKDGSIVTDADHAAEKIVLARLAALTPDIPIVSEEAVEAGNIPDISGGTFWTVDPLDGTREFAERTGAFVVAIALVVDGKPVLGVVYHPAMDRLYAAAGPQTSAEVKPDGTRVPLSMPANPATPPAADMRVLLNPASADMPKVKGYLSAQFGDSARIDSKSGILRACQVAENSADMSVVYPVNRGGRTKFWDVAAGHAIVEGAGGRVQDIDGKPLRYDAEDLQVPPHICLSARRTAAMPPKPPQGPAS
ncbi:MAG TPA: inositol monophosphatase family protein [Alphaproteobacteria bacterium]|nr:inositol monophosphatase family protein [Alphaproteobacteria bacterium]